MTERLSTLLHDQASVVDVPTAPTADILTRGRGIRRRRRATAAVAVESVPSRSVSGTLRSISFATARPRSHSVSLR